MEPGHIIERHFFDLEIFVLLTRDSDANRYLRVYETLSEKEPTIILDAENPLAFSNE